METIIPYTAEHDKNTVTWLNSNDLKNTFGLQQIISLESHRHWINTNTDVLSWAIVDPCQNHIGNTLLKINFRHQYGYFQIYIGDPSARGLGLGEKALLSTLKIAFETYALHRVWLHTFSSNIAAESLYKKNGFILEGIEREAICHENQFISQNRWSLLAEEWLALKLSKKL